MSNVTLESRFIQIENLITTPAPISCQFTTLLGAALMIGAEAERQWPLVGINEWLQVSKSWLVNVGSRFPANYPYY